MCHHNKSNNLVNQSAFESKTYMPTGANKYEGKHTEANYWFWAPPTRKVEVLEVTASGPNLQEVISKITPLIIDLILFSVEIAVTPKIDLGVIMGALSNPTLKTMKDATKVIIDKYGTEDARYSLITSGREASTKIDFTDGFKTAQDFKNAINAVQRPEGTPDLKKALDQAKKLFDDAPPRPDAKKILVVLIDQKSVNYPQVLSAGAKSLQEGNILVLPIAVGSLADLEELTRLAPSRGVVIEIDSDEDGAAIAQKIMNDGVKGKYCCCCSWCCHSQVSDVVVVVVTVALITTLVVLRCHLFTALTFSISIGCEYSTSRYHVGYRTLARITTKIPCFQN